MEIFAFVVVNLLGTFNGQYILFGGDADLARIKAGERQRNLESIITQPLNVVGG